MGERYGSDPAVVLISMTGPAKTSAEMYSIDVENPDFQKMLQEAASKYRTIAQN